MASKITDPKTYKWCSGNKERYSGAIGIYAHCSNKDELTKLVEYSQNDDHGLEIVHFEKGIMNSEIIGVVRMNSPHFSDEFVSFTADDVIIMTAPDKYELLPSKQFYTGYTTLTLKK